MILPIGEAKGNNAFSLIEILLVVVIIGIVIALASPNFSKGYSRFQIKQTADDLLSISRWAQAMAIGQEQTYALTFSADRHSYGLTREKSSLAPNDQNTFEPIQGALGKNHQIPDSIQLDSNEDQIKFYPDGTIDSARIKLVASNQKVELTSSQVRGMMMRVDGE